MKFCRLCRSNPAPAYQSLCHRCHDFCRRARPADELAYVKRRARKLAGNAVRAGTLIPQPCEVCGDPSEMHHPDYARPLDVRWLCGVHHHETHGQILTVPRKPRSPGIPVAHSTPNPTLFLES